jgi:hypothetical protein
MECEICGRRGVRIKITIETYSLIKLQYVKAFEIEKTLCSDDLDDLIREIKNYFDVWLR